MTAPVARVALFDLDGTLSDSAPGILACLRRTFAEMGVPPVDGQIERSLLGPPFRDILEPYVGPGRVEEAVARYRRYYGEGGGSLITTAYPGVADALAALQSAGVRLAVATSKAEAFVPPILDQLRLSGYFDVVTGDDLSGGRGTKAAVVGETLRRLGHPDPVSVLMVGDRSHDVIGAAAHGLATLGAGWGYGGAQELTAAGARVVLDRPDQLVPYFVDEA